MLLKKKDFYTFGDFHLDLAEKTLWREGKAVALTPKVFETLLVFVENAGRLLEKDELMEKIWRDSFVEESNLTFNVKTLRRALGDDAQNPQFIETVPRRGYRFIAEVRRSIVENGINGNGAKKDSFSVDSQPIHTPVNAQADLQHESKLEDLHKVAPVTSTDFSNGGFGQSSSALPISSVKRRGNIQRYVLTGLVCAVLVAVGIGYGLYRLMSADKAVIHQIGSALNIMRLTSSGNVRSAAVSPDGKFVAYVLDENTKHSFWLKSLHTEGQVQISMPPDIPFVSNITFSPDGNYIYYGTKNSLYQISVLGGSPKKVLSDYSGVPHNEITFSPDGKQFAFIRYQASEDGETVALIVAHVQSGSERIVSVSKRPTLFYRSAAWSPDGETIACVAQNAAGHQEIVAVNIANGVVLSIPSRNWSVIHQIAWRPDGNGLLAIAPENDSGFLSQIWSISYPLGGASKITDGSNDYQSLSLTADGNTIVAVRAEQEAHIWVASAEPDANRARQLTTGFEKFDGVHGITWTHDGRMVYEASPSGKPQVWQIDADGRNSEQLADESGSTTVSPDGKYLIYQSDDSDDGTGTGLFRLNWGDGEKKRLTTGIDIDPAFSPDGRWLVFTRYSDDVALWKVSVEGGEAIKLTNFPGYAMSPTISPDGKYIAFFHSVNSNKQSPLFAVIAFEGGNIIKQLNIDIKRFKGQGRFASQWTADGQALVYANNNEGISNLWRHSFDGTPPVQITNFDSGQIFNFAADPKGKQFALSRGTFSRDVVSIANIK